MVPARLRIPDIWGEAFREAGFIPAGPEAGLVFAPAEPSDQWEDVLAELEEAFRLTREAARGGGPVVYLVDGPDLLGQRGAGRAMVACGLLSGARTAAIEGVAVNVVAVEEGTPPAVIAVWAGRLLERDGPTGELVRLGGSHLGKALP